MNDAAMDHISQHDPATLNELAGLIQDGARRHVLLSERYGAAILILESEWLKDQRHMAWVDGFADGLASAIERTEDILKRRKDHQ